MFLTVFILRGNQFEFKNSQFWRKSLTWFLIGFKAVLLQKMSLERGMLILIDRDPFFKSRNFALISSSTKRKIYQIVCFTYFFLAPDLRVSTIVYSKFQSFLTYMFIKSFVTLLLVFCCVSSYSREIKKRTIPPK